jgi:hypothetical protein
VVLPLRRHLATPAQSASDLNRTLFRPLGDLEGTAARAVRRWRFRHISRFVCNVPGPRQGSRLFFAAIPFPGFQLHLLQQFPERGAYCYVTADSFRTVWLCSALLRYFTEAPGELYIRAEPKDFDRHIVGG